MDRTNEVPDRYWVMRPFSHFSQFSNNPPQVIGCAVCHTKLLDVRNVDDDKKPLLMFHDLPICPTHALEQISEHPITPTYLKWLEEGDPRWWSPWFCDCDGCEPLSETG